MTQGVRVTRGLMTEEILTVKKLYLLLFFLLFLWNCTTAALAAEFCVTNSVELQSALDDAESNNQSDTIRIATGSYNTPSGGFRFLPVFSEDAFDLTIIGGWSAFFENPCGQLLVNDPELTVLNGGASDRVLEIRLPQIGSVEVRNLSFINGLANDSFGGGGGLRAFQFSGLTYAGTLTVENNIFLLNSAESGGGLYIGSLAGTETVNVRVLNNLFVSNQATVLQAGAGVIQVNSPQPRGEIILDPRPAVTLAHNTVVNNSSVETIGGFWLVGNVTKLWVVSNNLWGNSGDDLTWLVNSTTRVLRNNNIEDLTTTPSPTSDVENISVVPEYVDCGALCVDRIPAPDSPLIDGGWAPFGIPGVFPWSLPDTDLNGGPRVRGAGVDIGAYEGIGDRVFSDRFENN